MNKEQALQLLQALFHMHCGDNAGYNVNEHFISVLRTLAPEAFNGYALRKHTLEKEDVDVKGFVIFLRTWAQTLDEAMSEGVEF